MEILAQNEATRLFLYHLAQSFFHGDAKGLCIKAQIFKEQAAVSLSQNGITSGGTAHICLSVHKEQKRAENAALGLAFGNAARKFTSYTPPYGTLTGVRPVKVALFYLNQPLAEKADVSKLLQDEFLVREEKAKLLTELAEKERSFAKTLSPHDAMLYISIPFCPSRCSYCSFISSAAPSHLALIPRYLEQLKEEITLTAKLLQEKEKDLVSVYMGGGTPGILSAEQMKDLLAHVKNELRPSCREFCVELGRPDTVTREKLEVLEQAAVNRISINPQTTCDETLRKIGRRHSAEVFFDAMTLAKSFPFAVNCDLISALPGETPEIFLNSVNQVLSLSPENITLHALCQKKSAEDRKEKAFSPRFAEAVSEAHRLCINAGLAPYYLYRQKMSDADLENLGFAKPGTLGVYNLAMMEDLCDIYACGAGGISKLIPGEKNGKIRRFAAYKYPFEYLDHPEKIHENLRLMRSF